MEDSYMNMNEEETRKRPLDDANDGRRTKRSNLGSGKPVLKVLVPNFVAGKLIGKGGSNINELQTKFSASIQVSPNKEYYPGTDERVVTISADTDQITNFTSHMIENIQVDQESERRQFAATPHRHDVKLVVTNVAAGLVIGKGGATIKAIQDESSAKINISKRDESNVPGERVVVITGSVEQRLKACTQIIEKMSAEPDKMSNSNIKYGNSVNMNMGNGHGHPLYSNLPSDASSYLFGGMPNGLRHSLGIAGNVGNSYAPQSYEPKGTIGMVNDYGHSNYEAKSRVKSTFQAQMEIPDNMVGSIVGKQGQTINEFSRSSGAKIQFSPKNDFAVGTTDRILTITGGMYQVQNAYHLIDAKVAQVENEFESGGFVRR